MNDSANSLFDKFIDLIHDLEKEPRDRFYAIRIKRKISKLKKRYLSILKNRTVFDIPYILNFAAFLSTISNMRIINNISIETEDVNILTKIYKIDISTYGIFMHIRIFDNGNIISIFDLKTKTDISNDIYIDITMKIFEPSVLEEKDYITSIHLDSVYSILNRNIDRDAYTAKNLDLAFVILKDSFSIHYNYIFDELERKYLNEK